MNGLMKIDNILNNHFKDFELTFTVGTDFECWVGENLITYALAVANRTNEWFMENFRSLAPDIECDFFLASLLHEVGHTETYFALTDDENVECFNAKMELGRRMDAEPSNDELKNIYFEYFNLPDEYEATMWAIEYMRNNSEEIGALWEKLKVAIKEFYIVNGVEV